MMNLIRIARPVFCFLLIFVCSCNGSETGGNGIIAENISQHYSIVYQEGDENLQVYAQFRAGGEKGPTIALTPPGSIQFDDSLLGVDNSSPGSIFYSQQLSVEDIYGEHQFVFTDMDKKTYENKFSLTEFRVNLPLSVHKDQPLNIGFETAPLQPSDYIKISPVGSDSSFSVIYSGTDTARYITILPADLQKQPAGQLKLAATLYRRVPLKEVTPGGGYLEISYALNPVYISLLRQ